MEKVKVRKICGFCGNEFLTTRGNKIYCSDACNLKNQIKLRQSTFSDNKPEKKVEKKKKKKKGKTDPLIETAKAAREAGMSYGMYVAWKEGRIRIETD